MIKLIRLNEPALFTEYFENMEELMKFIGAEASRLNYGIFRQWTIDNKTYFDCGPITYVMSTNE